MIQLSPDDQNGCPRRLGFTPNILEASLRALPERM